MELSGLPCVDIDDCDEEVRIYICAPLQYTLTGYHLL